jgi:hypothetical protein
MNKLTNRGNLPLEQASVAAMLGSSLLAAPAFAQTQTGAAAPATATVEARLSVNSGIEALLADEKGRAVINKYARVFVEFFGSGKAEGLAPGETPAGHARAKPDGRRRRSDRRKDDQYRGRTRRALILSPTEPIRSIEGRCTPGLATRRAPARVHGRPQRQW